MTPTEVGLTPAERAVVSDAARCMGAVSDMQAAKRGTRLGQPYTGPTADGIIQDFTDDWLHQVRLLSATVDYAAEHGIFTSYGGGNQYRKGKA